MDTPQETFTTQEDPKTCKESFKTNGTCIYFQSALSTFKMLKSTALELAFAQTKSPSKTATSTLMEEDAREIKDLEQA